jgi:hypothetical protein
VLGSVQMSKSGALPGPGSAQLPGISGGKYPGPGSLRVKCPYQAESDLRMVNKSGAVDKCGPICGKHFGRTGQIDGRNG